MKDWPHCYWCPYTGCAACPTPGGWTCQVCTNPAPAGDVVCTTCGGQNRRSNHNYTPVVQPTDAVCYEGADMSRPPVALRTLPRAYHRHISLVLAERQA